jgi:small subunit ribosomal protein S17
MRGNRKMLVGTVLTHKMEKTAVVLIERLALHPLYHKYIRKTKRYNVHDETNQAKVGDNVEIAECRPMSKTKSWRLVRVLAK